MMWIRKLHPSLPVYETSVEFRDGLHIGYQGYVVVLTDEGRFLPLFTTYAKWDMRDALKQLEEEKAKGDPSIATLAKVIYILRLEQCTRSDTGR